MMLPRRLLQTYLHPIWPHLDTDFRRADMPTSIDYYQRLPTLFQQIATAVYGLKLMSLRFGKSFRDELTFIQSTDFATSTAIQLLQLERLQALVRHAFMYVPHYRDLATRLRITANDISPQTIDALPMLTKAEIRAEPTRFISEQLSQSDRRTIFTSGTTGTPLEVVCTKTAIQRNYAFFYRFLAWHGLGRKSRSATFAGRAIVPLRQTRPPFWRPNPFMRNTQFSSYHLSPDSILDYITKLAALSPDFIDSYPSSIHYVARAINESLLPRAIRPKTIVTSSETLTAQQRDDVQRAFGCPVRDQYGSAEMAAFIAECPHGRYHVASEYGLLELLPGDFGHTSHARLIVATGFLNPTMPLIRYVTGDVAVPSDDACPCGRQSPVIESIFGRLDDVVTAPDGRAIGRLDPIFKGARGLVECQIQQVAPDHLVVRCVLIKGFGIDSMTPVISALRQRWSTDGRIDVLPVETIPRDANGKFRACIGLKVSAETRMRRS